MISQNPKHNKAEYNAKLLFCSCKGCQQFILESCFYQIQTQRLHGQNCCNTCSDILCNLCGIEGNFTTRFKEWEQRCITFCHSGTALMGCRITSLTLHWVAGFLLWPQDFFSVFALIFPCVLFSLQLFISGTKAKCLAVSQIKGLLLPPRKRWNNKHGRR